MLFLWNPTDQDIKYQYGGLSYTLKGQCDEFPDGQKKKVEEAEGRHVLNEFTAKGMTKLVFDDNGKVINEEQVKVDAIERCKNFKIKQITDYNRMNMQLKAGNKPYAMPTETVRKYAVELGIELLKPYEMAEGEKGQLGKLTSENQELKESVAVLTKQMVEMMEMIKNSKPEDSKKIRCKICNLRVDETDFERHMREFHKGG